MIKVISYSFSVKRSNIILIGLFIMPCTSYSRGYAAEVSPSVGLLITVIFIFFCFIIFIGENSKKRDKSIDNATTSDKIIKSKDNNDIKNLDPNEDLSKDDYSLSKYKWYRDSEGVKCDILKECYPDGEFEIIEQKIYVIFQRRRCCIKIDEIEGFYFYNAQIKLF